MTTNKELSSFHYVFRLSQMIVFEVNYYRLGDNNNKHFTTSAAQFNLPKTDWDRCGQAQDDLLQGYPLAMNFYKKFNPLHLKDLTTKQHDEILQRLEKLKEAYKYLYSENDGFSFFNIKELSKRR